MSYLYTIIRAIACPVVLLAVVLLHAGQTQKETPKSKTAISNSKQAAASSANDGQKIFEAICASCHGLDGRGGERGPNIATTQEVQNLSDSEILKILRDGKTYAGMPGFAGMGSERLGAILGHLRRLQGRNAAAELPGNPTSGKILFFGKGGCASCHMMQGRGGYMGSDLTEYGAGNSAQEIRESILHPNQDGDRRRRVVEVTTEDGHTFKGIARNEDNFSLQLQTLDGAFHLLQKNTVKSIKEQAASLMPEDYGATLTSQELDDLIHYLVSAAKTAEKPQGAKNSAAEDED